MVPPPLYRDGFLAMNQTVINEWYPKEIRDIANETGIKQENVIDIFNLMGGTGLTKYKYFCNEQSCDDCHPNDAGYFAMAKYIFQILDLEPLPLFKKNLSFSKYSE